MNRLQIAKSCYCITPQQKMGTAQSLLLGGDILRGSAGAFTQKTTIQRSALLETLTIFSEKNAGGDSQGTITEVTIGGQSCMVSDQPAALSAFFPQSFGAGLGAHGLGISVNQNMEIVIQGSTVAASNVGMSVALSPIPSELVQTRAQQATNYNVIFGLGEKTVPVFAAGVAGETTVVATSNRACTLGSIILANNSAATQSQDLVISSFKINGLELLAGPTGGQEIPFSCFATGAADVSGLTLGYEISPMTRIEWTVKNYDAANVATVAGTIFCLPWTTQKAPVMTHNTTARSYKKRG